MGQDSSDPDADPEVIHLNRLLGGIQLPCKRRCMKLRLVCGESRLSTVSQKQINKELLHCWKICDGGAQKMHSEKKGFSIVA